MLIRNKGKRIINYVGGSLHPQKTNPIEDKVAEILLKMFPNELVNVDEERKALLDELQNESKNEELEALKEEAKSLGIKGIHLYKTEEALKAKIEEAKASK